LLRVVKGFGYSPVLNSIKSGLGVKDYTTHSKKHKKIKNTSAGPVQQGKRETQYKKKAGFVQQVLSQAVVKKRLDSTKDKQRVVQQVLFLA